MAPVHSARLPGCPDSGRSRCPAPDWGCRPSRCRPPACFQRRLHRCLRNPGLAGPGPVPGLDPGFDPGPDPDPGPGPDPDRVAAPGPGPPQPGFPEAV